MDAILKTQAEKLAREMASQASTLDDLNDLLRGMMKTALERMLNTEMDVHLGRRTLSIDADAGASLGDVTPEPETIPPTRKNRVVA